MLDDLGQPGAKLAFWQSLQCIGVRQYEARLVEGADQVLGARVVDGRLAPGRGIHLGQERRRYLNEVDAAHVGRRHEAREISYRTTPQSDHGRASIEPLFEQAIPGLAGNLEGLGALALG